MYLEVAAYTNQVFSSLPQKQCAYFPYAYMQAHTLQKLCIPPDLDIVRHIVL